MKKLILTCLFLTIQNVYSFDIQRITLAENEKLESTFSIQTNKNESLHFVIVKNKETKKYLIKPYFISENQQIKNLDNFVNDELPNIIANHTNGDSTTVTLFYEKNSKLTVINFDCKSGKNSSEFFKDVKNPDLIFSEKMKTILINFEDNGKLLTVKTILNSKEITVKKVVVEKDIYDEFKKVAQNSPEAINQNEYVKNGSVNLKRAYISDNVLYFTNKKNNKETQVFGLDLEKENKIKYNNYVFGFEKPTNDDNSFVYKNNLLAINANKEDVLLKIYDIKSNEIIKNYSLLKELKGVISDSIFEKFLKESKKMNTNNTITVNRTVNNLLKIRIDRVKEFYTYNYNWWFHQNFMMMQMQMNMMNAQNNIPRFGPNATNFEPIFYTVLEYKFAFIEFFVDLNYNIVKESGKTEFIDFDRDKILEEYNENKKIKHFSTVFLDSRLQFMYQDKETKQVIIDSKIINQ